MRHGFKNLSEKNEGENDRLPVGGLPKCRKLPFCRTRFYRRVLSVVPCLALSWLVSQASADEVVRSAVQGFIDSRNYSWTASTELKGGPAAGISELRGQFDTVKGWSVETEVEGSSVRAVGRGEGRVANVGSGWLGTSEFSRKEEKEKRARELLMMALPHQELRMLKGISESMQPSADGTFTAVLDPEMARAFLLSVVSRRAPANAEKALKSATGELRVWVEGKRLIQYEIYLQANFSLGLLKRSVERAVTVEIRDLGQTEVEIPAEAVTALPSRIEL